MVRVRGKRKRPRRLFCNFTRLFFLPSIWFFFRCCGRRLLSLFFPFLTLFLYRYLHCFLYLFCTQKLYPSYSIQTAKNVFESSESFRFKCVRELVISTQSNPTTLEPKNLFPGSKNLFGGVAARFFVKSCISISRSVREPGI